jgi:hypothetical protein
MPSSGILRCAALGRFLQEAHGVTSQKTAFFIVTAVKTSNLANENILLYEICKKHIISKRGVKICP